MTKHYILSKILVIFLITNTVTFAQESTNVIEQGEQRDSTAVKKKFFDRIVSYFEEAKKDKSQSKFDLSFIGGPSYSVDTKLGLGIVASGLYRMDKEDMSLPPSDVAIYTNFTTSGFFSIGVENTTIFPDDKYRFHYDMAFKFMPSKFYGIGYDAGNLGEYTKYDEYHLGLKFDILRQVLPNTYVGLVFSAQNIQSRNFQSEEIRPDTDSKDTAIGGGFIASYDSRDFIPNPSKGLFIQYEQTFYPKTLGSNKHFGNIKFTTRAYKQVWKDGLLAFDLNGEFNNGDVPWTMLSKIGGSRQMRGYFMGQYRDRKQINTQIELRQKIYNRHGVAVWGGAGNAFKNMNEFDWSHTLPTYGIGYRWEFKNRVNVRLDYGFGKGQSGFYFNIYESF
ncbi:BamA/TamA family outer membrane protein [Myroides marinus]|uniref:BamA/TamA family outer membrane protein n=1 Tax=Myroides marinus TaxID=703342 RepID=UPI0025762377|nr:BamA/TamA family outer membrane protein [Myroides marinus]MDM1347088.1 BamA/TamA family outer membrane protein [Myroides marinus]MDM1350607.1 BamA/TamA family outer membrane protein [Myroides marinus]MDM1354327.1 BamA/TamA family outer membrane protein [Myroides marinus]MDM1357814.1 BamA/TamA family outer membrane protein [Myroides marinus]MDM1365252.1 BamA/TamA family outer membrane protein [Myroides marinus]